MSSTVEDEQGYSWVDPDQLPRFMGSHAPFQAHPITTERGHVVWRHDVDRDAPMSTRGAAGGVSGTLLGAIANMACVHATATVLRPGERNATAEFNISYLRPAMGDVIFTEARILSRGRTIAFVEFTSRDGQDRLVTQGRAVQAISGSATEKEVASTEEYLHRDLEELQHQYQKTKRGHHPAFELQLTNCARGSLSYEYTIPDGPGRGHAGQPGMGGSMMVAVTDLANVAAVSTLMKSGERFNGTVELNLSMMHLASGAGTKVLIESRVIRKGRAMAFAESRLVEEHTGRLVGVGRIVYAVGAATKL